VTAHESRSATIFDHTHPGRGGRDASYSAAVSLPPPPSCSPSARQNQALRASHESRSAGKFRSAHRCAWGLMHRHRPAFIRLSHFVDLQIGKCCPRGSAQFWQRSFSFWRPQSPHCHRTRSFRSFVRLVGRATTDKVMFISRLSNSVLAFRRNSPSSSGCSWIKTMQQTHSFCSPTLFTTKTRRGTRFGASKRATGISQWNGLDRRFHPSVHAVLN
jgi:hypothetical protein